MYEVVMEMVDKMGYEVKPYASSSHPSFFFLIQILIL